MNIVYCILYNKCGRRDCCVAFRVNPYTSFTENPVHEPLNPSRRVFVEYSNEIWSAGPDFSQGEWAATEAAKVGLSKAAFNARKFCDFFNIFR